MAYDYDDSEASESAEVLLESVQQSLMALEERVKKVGTNVEDAAAGLRLEIAQNRREMVELRSSLSRLQARFDNQLMTLVFANVASGLGAAALVLGLSHAI